MSPKHKPLVWLHGEVKTTPLSKEARIEAGYLLLRLQRGDSLGMPHSRPMPTIGPRCYELRIIDEGKAWRIIYLIDADAVIILEVFSKTTNKTPKNIIEVCKHRLRNYDSIA